jgi:polyribonucleotide nucleotidyltransferase
MSDAVTRVSVEIAGKEISFETGKLAKQASGAVVVQAGDTMVLCTATAGNIRDVDFLPLTVDVEERMYAAGKIPGSFFKREGRAGEKGTLTARMIDRPIRPLFPKGWRYETQLVAIPMSVDHVNPYDILAMNGASAALMISSIPVPTAVGAVRIGKIDGNFVVNPDEEDLLDNTDLDLIVAGTTEGILMVEAGASEIPEAEILDALDIAHDAIKKLCAAQEELREKAGKEKTAVEVPQVDPELYEQIKASHGAALEAATQVEDKLERQDATKAVEEQILEQYAGDPESATYAEYKSNAQRAFDKLEKSLIRERIAIQKKRPDGRTSDEIRPISIEVSVAPRTHGSALFTRGETQALVVATLGTKGDEQNIDALEGEYRERFMLHYNMPPFATGETGRVGSPKRREIGHGRLAKRALAACLPSADEFGYSIRVVSEITESNGSSSMASVCGGCLALMDAGVPMKAHVAGIAMGLILEGNKFAVLTDILGDEDHLGDMDFKVAGTEQGVTALQMDIKIQGITKEIMQVALAQAKEGRMHILGKMTSAVSGANTQLSEFAPRMITIKINPEKIRDVIGKGGSVIRALTEETGTTIDISDDGVVTIASTSSEGMAEAKKRIENITLEVEVGQVYEGTVLKLLDFGAIVNILPGKDGLLHISEIANERIKDINDYLKDGQQVKVKVIQTDEKGRVRLSAKALLNDAASGAPQSEPTPQ